MQTYVALLRGINVGGNRKVEMAKLRHTFESEGFSSVKTLIASGNVIFQSNIKDNAKLTNKIEKAIEAEFGFKVDVLVLEQNLLKKLLEAIPDHWVNDKETKCDVMFLWPEVDNPEVLESLPYNSEIEDVRYIPGAALWRIDRLQASKSRMIKINTMPLYKQMTIRNPNTVRKIYQMMQEG